jgi:hypothetical protein
VLLDDVRVAIHDTPILGRGELFRQSLITEHTSGENETARIASTESASCEYRVEKSIVVSEKLDPLGGALRMVPDRTAEKIHGLRHILVSMQ